MSSRLWVVSLSVLLTVAGCAWIQQAGKDVSVGKTAPLAEGEVSVGEAAHTLIDPIVPYLPEPVKPVAGVLVSLLALVGAWRRGRKIRLQQPASANPITGNWGKNIGVEKIVQVVTTAIRGATEVGPEGSGWRRAWKTILAGGTAAIGLAATFPGFRELVTSNPTEFGTFVSLAALLGALEKEVSKVLPVKEVGSEETKVVL